jgi:glycosyltransferase involved in cell wall biosynthesis
VTNANNRIVHICSVGIIAKLFLVEHLRRQRLAGFQVILMCYDDKDARYAVQASGVEYMPLAIKQGVAPFSGLMSMVRLWWYLRHTRPAIFDAHGSKAAFVGIPVSWLARIPIRIYHNHGMALLSSTGMRRRIFRVVESVACYFATRVIYVAPSNMEDAITAGVCRREKAAVLGPGTISGVDTDRFDPEQNAPRGVELRKQAGIPAESAVCGFVGRIVPHKGVETILEAWRLLPSEIRSNAYLCMFGALGTRSMYARVEDAASNRDLHIRYMGFSNDLPGWYATMALLVQPSWHEGWGYNVLEAACSGVPAIGTKISATVDAIIDGKTGLLVPVKDPQAMADAIATLLQDDTLRRRLGLAARERVVAKFSEDEICPLLIQEYKRLLAQIARNQVDIPLGD